MFFLFLQISSVLSFIEVSWVFLSASASTLFHTGPAVSQSPPKCPQRVSWDRLVTSSHYAKCLGNLEAPGLRAIVWERLCYSPTKGHGVPFSPPKVSGVASGAAWAGGSHTGVEWHRPRVSMWPRDRSSAAFTAAFKPPPMPLMIQVMDAHGNRDAWS